MNRNLLYVADANGDLQALVAGRGLLSLTDEEFGFIAENIQRRSGIQLPLSKRPMVLRRLSLRLRECGLEKFSQYRPLLERSDSEEWNHLVNVLTTNHSSFFREIHHFRLLAELIAERADRSQVPLKVWSAACATGEEPYSIAMTMMHYVPTGLRRQVNILATDIDDTALRAAGEAVFSNKKLEQLPKFARDMVEPHGEGNFRVAEDVRRMVTFRRHNLMDSQWPNIGVHDLVFCRNVLIYFSAADQHRVLQRFGAHIEVGGCLCIGHSETVPAEFDWLGRTGVPTAFRKINPNKGTGA